MSPGRRPGWLPDVPTAACRAAFSGLKTDLFTLFRTKLDVCQEVPYGWSIPLTEHASDPPVVILAPR